MPENPYQPPMAERDPASLAFRRRVGIGEAAAMMSTAGLLGLNAEFLGLNVFSWEPLYWLLLAVSLLCPLGFMLGMVGLWYGPKRSARLAVLLGFLGTLYLPTTWLFLFRAT